MVVCRSGERGSEGGREVGGSGGVGGSSGSLERIPERIGAESFRGVLWLLRGAGEGANRVVASFS